MVWHQSLERPRPAKQIRAQFFVTREGVAIVKAKALTPAQRRAIFERDKYRCVLCSKGVTWTRWESRSVLSDTSVGHVDHIIPRARGGQNVPDNLRLTCEYCNESRGARDG